MLLIKFNIMPLIISVLFYVFLNVHKNINAINCTLSLFLYIKRINTSLLTGMMKNI